MSFGDSSDTAVVPAVVVIITGVLFAFLLLVLIACLIGIIWMKKKDEEKVMLDGIHPSVLQKQPGNGYNHNQMMQLSQSVDATNYTNLQVRLTQSFARIKELEDRIDLETNEECQTFYDLQDGLKKASNRLDIIEYTIQSDQSGVAIGVPPRRQESVFSRTSRGTMNTSVRYADTNQSQSSRGGLPPASYQTASSSSYDRRQTSIPQAARRDL